MTAPYRESIARARRAIVSARALFRAGLIPECHAYMALGLRSLLDSWITVGNSSEVADSAVGTQSQALAALEAAKYPRIERLLRALEANQAERPPVVRTVLPGRERDFDWIWSEVDRLARFTDRHFAPADARKRFRIRLAVTLLPLLILASLFYAQMRSRPRVLASSSFAEEYGASQVVDGLEATEWLLPDSTLGWVDLIFSGPRTIHGLTLVNAHNSGFVDRGAGRVRVTAFGQNGAEVSAEVAFTQTIPERSALDVALEAKGVTRLRVEILSYLKLGGGLAEVELH